MAPAFTKRHRGLDATWVHRVKAAARRIARACPSSSSSSGAPPGGTTSSCSFPSSTRASGTCPAQVLPRVAPALHAPRERLLTASGWRHAAASAAVAASRAALAARAQRRRQRRDAAAAAAAAAEAQRVAAAVAVAAAAAAAAAAEVRHLALQVAHRRDERRENSSRDSSSHSWIGLGTAERKWKRGDFQKY
jgi:hypothetical protein